MRQLVIAALLYASSVTGAQPTEHFKFAKEQRVYIVAAETQSRNLSETRDDLQADRRAQKEFKKLGVFEIANALRQADFVFFVLIDSESRDVDELAVAITPADYEKDGSNFDRLRNVALWQSSGHLKTGRHAALAGATVGYSAFFDHPSVIRDLVKKFHREVVLTK